MVTDTKDTTTMTGAEFQRHVGTDAQKWALAFIAACQAFDWMPTACRGTRTRGLRRKVVCRLR